MLPILDRFFLARFAVPYLALSIVVLATEVFARTMFSIDGLLFGLAVATLTVGVGVFGPLVRSSEILALRAGGVSLVRMLRMPLGLSVLSTLCFLVALHVRTDALGWWRIVAASVAIPLAMVIALPLAIITARRDEQWIAALGGLLAYGLLVVTVTTLQSLAVIDTIRGPWLADAALAIVTGLVFRKSSVTR